MLGDTAVAVNPKDKRWFRTTCLAAGITSARREDCFDAINQANMDASRRLSILQGWRISPPPAYCEQKKCRTWHPSDRSWLRDR
jgi:hypothetical protein